MIDAVDSIEATEPVGDNGDNDEEMRRARIWIIEESIRQNAAKNDSLQVVLAL